MNILAISDTHLKRFPISEEWVGNTDVVIHCGDLLNDGWYVEFVRAIDLLAEQLIELKCSLCLIVPGNHCKILESAFGRNNCQEYLDEVNKKLNLNINLVIDELVEVQGFRIFMSPYYLRIGEGKLFGFDYTKEMAAKLFSEIIPDDVDILVTHGSGYGVLDFDQNHVANKNTNHYGCKMLAEFLAKRNDIFVHIHGHNHIRGGEYHLQENRTTYNVACTPRLITVLKPETES